MSIEVAPLPSTNNKGLVKNYRGGGGGNFEFGFENEVTHPRNGSEIC